uniref:Uncharacterized protein n=1 Tax=Oryza brachyantha TaxID=4533 RepID=J3M7F8_ORYBR
MTEALEQGDVTFFKFVHVQKKILRKLPGKTVQWILLPSWPLDLRRDADSLLDLDGPGHTGPDPYWFGNGRAGRNPNRTSEFRALVAIKSRDARSSSSVRRSFTALALCDASLFFSALRVSPEGSEAKFLVFSRSSPSSTTREMARSEQSAAAAPPALLPTPPRSKMMPLLPTPCLVILPASFASPSQLAPKPGRADSVARWDAHKAGCVGAASPPTERRAANRGRSNCRADACDRWDSKKAASPSRSSTSSSSSSSRASSAERWDAHKKARLQAGAVDCEKGRDAANTTSPSGNSKQQYNERRENPMVFAGPSFASRPSPEPCMFPLPNFLTAH